MHVEAYAQRKNKKAENFRTQFSQSPFHIPNEWKKKWTRCQVTSFCARNPERGTVFEISRWSTSGARSTMTLLYIKSQILCGYNIWNV